MKSGLALLLQLFVELMVWANLKLGQQLEAAHELKYCMNGKAADASATGDLLTRLTAEA